MKGFMDWIDKDTISIQWSTLDVKQQLKDRDKKEKLNLKECREVLSRCLRRHDATMGLSWDIMDIHIDDVIEERNKKDNIKINNWGVFVELPDKSTYEIKLSEELSSKVYDYIEKLKEDDENILSGNTKGKILW